jgi:hypothetical protein
VGELQECVCSHHRYESVATEVEGVSQSQGTPISAATNLGFRSAFGDPLSPSDVVVWGWRPAERTRFDMLKLSLPGAPWPSWACGVGHIRTWFGKFVLSYLSPFVSLAVSVDHIDDTAGRCGPLLSISAGDAWPRYGSSAIGVGQQPEPFASVGCANGDRGEQTPFRIEPEVGKVGADVRKPSGSNNVGDVLQQDESRSHVSDDPACHRPEVSVIVKSLALTGSGERLAWEAGSDDVHATSERCRVERVEVIPDRSLIQGLVFHPRHEYGRCVAVPLNVSHGAGGDSGESEGEFESAVSGAEVEGM